MKREAKRIPKIVKWWRNNELSDSMGSVVVRALVLPLSGIATIVSSRIVVEDTGASGFGWFSLLISLPLLVPISDFGIGATVTDTLAKFGPHSRTFEKSFIRVLKLLLIIASVTMTAALLISWLGGWGILLGLPDDPAVEVASSILMFAMAVGIPLGLGQRVLLSLGRQALSTLLLGSGSLVSICGVVVVHAGPTPNFAAYAAAFSIGPLFAQSALAIAAWRIYGKSLRTGSVSEPNLKIKIARVAWPMAVIGLALPMAYQSDRLLLSHLSSASELANYSTVAILYAPLLSILSVGGQTLWPKFLRPLGAHERRSLYRRANWLFVILGLLLGLSIVLIGPYIVQFISDEGVLAPPLSSYVLFALMLLLFAAHTTNGMFLMDYEGRKIQAFGSALLLIVKIPLALFLVPIWGSSAAILSTLIAASLCLVIPSAFVVSRRIKLGQ